MAEEGRRMPSIGEGIRTGVGLLSAFREAIEETIQEAAGKTDFTPDRAKQALTDALDKAQETVGGVRDRLDLVPRRDFDALRAEVAELRRRLDALEGRSAPEDMTLLAPPSSTPLDVPPSDPPGGDGPLEGRMP